MNELLVQNGILPEFKYSLPTQEPSIELSADTAKADIPPSEIEQVDETHDSVDETPGNSHGRPQETPVGQQAAKGAATSGLADEGMSSGEGRPPLPETEQDIYALVDELHQLRERLGTSGQNIHEGSAGQETEIKGVNTYLAESSANKAEVSPEEHTQAGKVLFTQGEVLQALANVEQNITRLDRSEIRKGQIRNSQGYRLCANEKFRRYG
jgi:hypothetical protein